MSFEQFCIDNKIALKKDEIMKTHTSFKIGGSADYFVTPKTPESLKAVISAAGRFGLPYFILGKGSNLLVADKGIRGVVISLAAFDDITVNRNEITVGAGATLATLCNEALKQSLSGLEFAYGIPGSVGGALYMNAGAYDGEMAQVVLSATVLDKQGNIKTVDLKDMSLGYRTSIFKTSGDIILSVRVALSMGKAAEIKAKMDDFMARRKSKQPLEYPSAGSTFKRPVGYFAGALIEQNGLKGMRVGGAMVSEKHAGFVINYDNATACEVTSLMDKIRQIVLEKNGVELEAEVILVGEE